MSAVHFVLLIAVTGASPSPEANGYDVSMAEAEARVVEDRLEEAAQILEGLTSDFPQDYRVAIALARVEYRRGRFEAAHAAYSRALALSEPGSDAQLGLGWTHLRLREPDAARADFDAVLEARPGHAGAREGLAAARAAWPALSAWSTVTGQRWPGHPAKDWAGAVGVGLRWRPTRWLAVGAQYRGATFLVKGAQALDPPLADFSQHEAWLSLGYESPRLSLLGTYAFVHPRGQPDYEAHVAAVSVGLRLYGAAWLDGALSRYPDRLVGQVGLSYRLPLGAGFWVTPEGRLQVSDVLGGAGGLEVGWGLGRFSLWIAATEGRQVRPVSLRPRALYNLPEQVRLGARGGLQLELTAGWFVFGEYELVELVALEPGGYRAWLHLATLGLAVRR